MDEIYLNGKFIKKSDAQISIMDRGFLFGDGVYELIPVYNNKIFLLQKHLERLKNSLSLIGMKFIDGLEEKRNHVYPKSIVPTVLIMCEEYPTYNQEQITTGFSACVQEDFRWLKSNIKSISLLGNVLLKNLAHMGGFYETLLIRNNKLTEGSASNVFTVKDSKIYTPRLSNELLPGVTRDLLIDLLKDHDMKVIESDISHQDLLDSDEVWCSSSTNAVVPIVRVDDALIGSGKTGDISLLTHKITKEFIRDY